MEHAAGQHETMPDRVVIGQPLPDVENDAQRVRQPTQQQQPQTARRNAAQHRLGGDHHRPAHAHVQGYGNEGRAPSAHDAQHDADQRQSPDDAEQRPAPGSAQIHQQKRGVSAGDQNKNRRMVECPQYRLDAGQRDAVVQGRGGVEQDQGCAEDAASHDVPGVAVQAGEGGQYPKTGDAEYGAHTMNNAVGDFLAQRIARQLVFDSHRRFPHSATGEQYNGARPADARRFLLPVQTSVQVTRVLSSGGAIALRKRRTLSSPAGMLQCPPYCKTGL